MPPDYYSYDRLFDRVHALGGVTGFTHQAVLFHGYRGLVLNAVRGKTDFIELAQFCVPLLLDERRLSACANGLSTCRSDESASRPINPTSFS